MTAESTIGLRPRHSSGAEIADVLRGLGASEHRGGVAQRLPGATGGSVRVLGATVSTADVRPGDLWVGLPGASTHGARFAPLACALGAVAVLTDERGVEVLEAEGGVDAPVFVLERLRERLGGICARIHGTSRPGPTLLGVTGTNGKTSTAHMIHGALGLLGVRAGLSSTVERRICDEGETSGLTTPEATDLHAMIAAMREREVRTAAFEVSAQALSRHRVDGVRFDVVGFTNLSHDHLDDYGNMERYFEAKAELFTAARAVRGVVALETEWGRRLLRRSEIPLVTVGASPDADWRVRVLGTEAHGTSFELSGADGRSLRATSPVPGAHMAGNMALAVVMLLESGHGFDELADALAGAELPAIPGRTENVAGPGAPAVYVDFGHSPDAFRRTLETVRAITPGRVVMVFGADGDRDTSKRADMAAEAVLGSDVLVVTDHHPRFEDPARIRSTLARAALQARPDAELHVTSPPPSAIRLAVSLAEPGDSIVWAGPGHQSYRDVAGVRLPYSAREEARRALLDAGYEIA